MSSKRTIKRYQNRKLYDTKKSRYITLDEIAILVRRGEDVQIIDNTSKEDLTSITLTQILVEQEKKHKRLPLGVLKNFVHGKSADVADFLREKVASPVTSIKDEAEKTIDDLQNMFDDKVKVLTDRFRQVSELKEEIKDLTQRVEKLEARSDDTGPGTRGRSS